MKSDIEMTDSSRYAPTCSLTPGWSRAIWPEETPRIATVLCPGPRFWTLNPATFAATSSIVWAPRSRRVSSVGAATESGVDSTVSSRFIAVTLVSAANRNSSVKSTTTRAPAVSPWSFRTATRKPCMSAVTW